MWSCRRNLRGHGDKPAADTLALWDIVTALDAEPAPNPAKPWQLPRGQHCAYVITLAATDTTLIDDATDHNTKEPINFAINIINDLPGPRPPGRKAPGRSDARVSQAGTWLRFVLAALAVWRLTHLLAAEDGPWDAIVRVRRALGDTIWGKMLDCFNCLSLWIAIPFACFVATGVVDRCIGWLALSGAACLANRLGSEPVVFDTLERQDKHQDKCQDK